MKKGVIACLVLSVAMSSFALTESGYIRACELSSLPGWHEYVGDAALLTDASEFTTEMDRAKGPAGVLSWDDPVLSLHHTTQKVLDIAPFRVACEREVAAMSNLRKKWRLPPGNSTLCVYLAHNTLVDISVLASCENRPCLALWLSDNQLTALPTGLTDLVHLQKLCLDTNKLTSITGLESLTRLKDKLCLRDNLLTAVPEIASMPKLQSLDIRHNKIAKFEASWLAPSGALFELCVDDETLLPLSWCTNYVALVDYYSSPPRVVRLSSGRIFIAGVTELDKWVEGRLKWRAWSFDCMALEC